MLGIKLAKCQSTFCGALQHCVHWTMANCLCTAFSVQHETQGPLVQLLFPASPVQLDRWVPRGYVTARACTP